jgi:acetyltransferase-like isoleucine patch superfamily enzyme
MKKSPFRRAGNRLLHLLARYLPGATSLRPALHRLRGVQIGEGVFIGDEVYLENEYPDAIEIQSGVQISVRAMVIAHTRGPGRVVIEKDAFIGPSAIIVASGARKLRIGEGAVIGAAVVITRDVPAHVFVASPEAKPVATVRVPLTRAEKMDDFVRGLTPLRRTIPKRITHRDAAESAHDN